MLSSAPILEHLDICVNKCAGFAPAQDEGGSISLDLSGCCAVRSLNVEGNTLLHRDFGRLEFLKEALLGHDPSSLGVDNEMSCTHLLSFLRSTPSLERLSVHVTVCNVLPLVLPTQAVRLPRLVTIVILFAAGHTALDAVFQNLHLPSLENLDITISSLDVIAGGFRHATSLQKVRDLKLAYWQDQGPGVDGEIDSLLSFVPALKSLHISAQWLTSMDMEQLTLPNRCPELESITFDSDTYRTNVKTHLVHPNDLVALIATRWRTDNGEDTETPSRGLKRISLRLPGLPDITTMEPVRSYVEQGLVVEFF